MNNEKQNIFRVAHLPLPTDEELIEQLFSSEKISIERIISVGQTTPEGRWYDQEKNEWVLLLQGAATIEFENFEIIDLVSGDYLFIPAHNKHRVTYTSSIPPCIWLAVYCVK